MTFKSTRRQARAATLSEAILAGQAPDGGLYMPETLPEDVLSGLSLDAGLPETAACLLAPFFAGDRLESELSALCGQAFNFDVPVTKPDPARSGLRVLELFHGPTGAFKDFGARFLMACFDRLGEPGVPLTVLTATSGDTGGAVGCAVEGLAGLRAVILFAKGRVSPFQRHQLTCWNEPVAALEVDGDFDSCQALVKQAFRDRDLAARHRLTSANSINLGRLLPQSAYLAWAARKVAAETGERPGLILPTGNLGHCIAALFARAMKAPLGPVVLATNANATLSDWAASGAYRPRPSVRTLANAMDIGAPSNFERLGALPAELRDVRVERVDDDTIRARIRADYADFGRVWCPHTATAAEAYSRLSEADRTERPWILAATAHPYKFAEIVEPLIERKVDPSPELAAILDRGSRAKACPADLDALTEHLDALTETA